MIDSMPPTRSEDAMKIEVKKVEKIKATSGAGNQ